MWSKRILIIKSPVCILVKVITIIDNPELIVKTSNDCYSLHWNMISNVTHRRDIKSLRISCFKPNELLQRFLAYWSVYIRRWDSIIYASVYCFRSLLICLLCLCTKLQHVLWYSSTLCRCCYKYIPLTPDRFPLSDTIIQYKLLIHGVYSQSTHCLHLENVIFTCALFKPKRK